MRPLLLLLCCASPAPLLAQTLQATVPAIAAELPGNAGMSMPLRWGQGVLQVQIDKGMLPAALVEGRSITALRLRRPTLVDEPAYAALNRQLVVRAGFCSQHANTLVQDLAANRAAVNATATGTGLVTVFGPATVAVPATAATTHADRLGAGLMTIPLSPPLPVPPAATLADAGLFVEFETVEAVFGADPGNWVDAVWVDPSAITGYAVPLGSRGCDPAHVFTLVYNTGSPPRRGVAAQLGLDRAVPGALVVTFFGLEPLTHAVNPVLGNGFHLGLGQSLASLGMPGCVQWSPMDAIAFGTSSQTGAYSWSIALPPAYTTVGMMLSVQAAELAPTANPLGVVVSNGQALVLDDNGIAAHCASVMFLGVPTATSQSPWPAWQGLMPVLGLDF